jgi:ATP-binding cassette, subfamily F, member 3
MIQLSDLTKSFGDRVLLDHVTWQISDGERVGLCGPNGAGKTTLLKMLAKMDEPDGGEIITPAALTIGYLPQDGLSHAGRTVFEGSEQRVPAAARHETRDARHRASPWRRVGAG